MEQTVYLAAGEYEFDFYYQPETANADDNGIYFGIDGWYNWFVDATTATGSGWQKVSQTFYTASDDSYDVYFSVFGDFGTIGGNGLGGFIDSASLDIYDPVPVPVTGTVPEPGTMLLLGAGLLGIVAARKKCGRLG